jgi:hypothetical protein
MSEFTGHDSTIVYQNTDTNTDGMFCYGQLIPMVKPDLLVVLVLLSQRDGQSVQCKPSYPHSRCYTFLVFHRLARGNKIFFGVMLTVLMCPGNILLTWLKEQKKIPKIRLLMILPSFLAP